MTTIQELRNKRAKAWEDAKRFLDAHRQENGTILPADNAVYEKMEKEVMDLGEEIKRLERQEALDKELAAPTSSPIIERPTTGLDTKSGLASDEYKQAFWDVMRHQKVSNALKIGTDTEGGYLVPDEFEKKLIEALEEENIFRQHANVIQTSTGERKIPIAVSKGTASWIEEEGAVPESDDAFAQISIGAFKLGTMMRVSEELLQDSAFDLDTYIAKEFARRIGSREEEAFFVGDGKGKPIGLLNDDNGAELGVTTAGDKITFDEIMDLFYSLRAPYRSKASFYLNDATVKAIRKLKDANGNYIWQPSTQAGEPDKILNRPYYTSQYMPAVEAGSKAIAFGDLGYYWIADRQNRNFRRLNELYAPTGQVGFLATERVDGKLILPEAVKVLQLHA